MGSSRQGSQRPGPATGEPPSVAVVGGGLAGLTAALRLVERGYRTTVYEQKHILGGNVASRHAPYGARLDVYPHMCPSWYLNFWQLLSDVTEFEREVLFAPFSRVAQLRRGDYPSFSVLRGPETLSTLLRNMFSGVQPAADMFLIAYAGIDMLATALDPSQDLSVDEFLRQRPYMTERVARATDTFITRVWAIRSAHTSLEDYRTFVANATAEREEWLWMARGPAEECIVAPIVKALSRHGAKIMTGVQATGISCDGPRVGEITLRRCHLDPESGDCKGRGKTWTDEADEVVLAVPPMQLSQLVQNATSGQPVVEIEPSIDGLSQLRAERVPMVHLYLKEKYPLLPPEPVGLFDSDLCLSFIDISQTWDRVDQFADRTVLALAASEPNALPGVSPENDAMAMITELAEYIDLDPGNGWGDSPEIDWDLTLYEENPDTLLFVNEAGTNSVRPRVSCGAIENLSLAGDFCRSTVGMTTLESAVMTGLEAARAVVERRGFGTPIEIHQLVTRPALLYRWLRFAWAPYAAAAKAWSVGADYARVTLGQHT